MEHEAPIVAVVGGGQLARMMQSAAVEIGVHLRVLCGSADDPAAQVCPDVVIGRPDDPQAIAHLCAGAQVLTFEHELLPSSLFEQVERDFAGQIAVRPAAAALEFARDKVAMRRRLSELGVPCPRWSAARLPEEVEAFGAQVGWPVVAKVASGGYDGRGVAVVDSPGAFAQWDTTIGADREVLLEEKVAFVRELSLVGARSATGEIRFWPLVQSVQEEGQCALVIAPAPDPSEEELAQWYGIDVWEQAAMTAREEPVADVDPAAQVEYEAEYLRTHLADEWQAQAEEIGALIARELDITGVFAVELFQTRDLERPLLVNELAMRPHNTAHWTQDGAFTSQFEQHLRAVLGLPLGSGMAKVPLTVMANILGSQRPDWVEEAWRQARQNPFLKVHLYGKDNRPKRKIGHLNLCSDGLSDTCEVAQAAARAIMSSPA